MTVSLNKMIKDYIGTLHNHNQECIITILIELLYVLLQSLLSGEQSLQWTTHFERVQPQVQLDLPKIFIIILIIREQVGRYEAICNKNLYHYYYFKKFHFLKSRITLKGLVHPLKYVINIIFGNINVESFLITGYLFQSYMFKV